MQLLPIVEIDNSRKQLSILTILIKKCLKFFLKQIKVKVKKVKNENFFKRK